MSADKAQRFGFITTNSIKQTFNRRVMQAALDGSWNPTDAETVAGKAAGRKAGGLMLPNAQKSAPSLAPPSLKPISLVFAVADHPWVDGANGAAVRIAMTAAQAGEHTGRLLTVQSETPQDDGEVAVTLSEAQGLLHADLRIGANVAAAKPLKSTFGISNRGFELGGAGFIVTRPEASQLGLGAVTGIEKHIREYRNGRDLTGTPRDVMVIDLFGLTADQVREEFPSVYQWVLERVKPERDVNRNELLRTRWWLHRRLREDLRMALDGLPRYIVTVETAKHRVFQFLNDTVLPDNKLVAIALQDGLQLGILSSEIHVTWTLAAGSTLEDRPVYVKTTCFETFPFPAEDTGLTPALTERIRLLAEQLDAHRKTQQAAHPDLTLTGMYNVLEKLRNGEALTAKDKTMHEQGLVSVLRTLHDELDAAVLQAYGWSDLGPVPHQNDAAHAAWTDALLLRLVDLNTRRAAEEASGTIRWLRPDYQNPATPKAPPVAQQASLDMDHDTATQSGTKTKTKQSTKKNSGIDTADAEDTENASHAATAKPASQQAWPTTVPEQIKAVAAVLSATPVPLDMDAIAAHFKAKGRWRDRLPVILDTLVAIGRVRQQGETYASC
ncbi:hypothetical protein B9Z47_04015 [Limnohabitans sp. 2KL-1]|uniref:type IIL restriction-modification enzyme MmeI n=1 Tax=Limnohabitans sp. 2KL-1 TaxID=1100699 RepID=UPI000D3B5FEE|nr:hypothetical protein B9Z47_04015 [Limnohabitans sp. 2KL-1]